ncbi:hypothetical protein [Aestuariivirga litoralis]|uniref:hypothetical protein n=1 Tax=Aestuariivirga litoralis TaxID=2650924 RepID=UPI0018C76106|nr:hypothetical protein [Aestuariivirga litoralis]MBG1233765.1 hypothetical protein [Aestuariivirga litoralis]
MLKALSIPLLVLLAVALAGCGTYRPLYGTASGGGNVATTLAAMSVQEQHDRAGQLVRNELLDGANTGRQRYDLKLAVREGVIGVTTFSSGNLARQRYNLQGHYELVDTQSSKVITSGDTFSNVEFNTLKIPVADLQAADNARTRAAKELGQDIRLRLAAYLSAHQG